MENRIVGEFKQLRVFTAVDLRQKMDALVHDLTHALEESSACTSGLRRRRTWKRRSKSTGNLALACKMIHSDDSSSSLGDFLQSQEKGMSSLQQSDSDDVSPVPGSHRRTGPYDLMKKHGSFHGSLAESDSVNENFSPVRPHTRRKRKFKRMALDPDAGTPSTSQAIPVFPLPRVKKKKVTKHSPSRENRMNSGAASGKRKRSVRERSLECDPNGENSSGTSPQVLGVNIPKPSAGGKSEDSVMDCCSDTEAKCCEITSSSTLSSSESDVGVYTNDEGGREADDEQSDWFHDTGPACGVPGVEMWQEEKDIINAVASVKEKQEEVDSKFQAILTGSFNYLSEETKEAYKARVKRLQEGMPGREIRAGRRRIRDRKPGFSILTSANEKLSKFLQDTGQSELRLHPMQKKEQDQLSHLADLYSLNMRSEGNSGLIYPVLTKTRNTTQAVKVGKFAVPAGPALHIRPFTLGDYKRLRRTPPTTPPPEGYSGEVADPIPDDNIGNQMLQNMGWQPGQGLGMQNDGIITPIMSSIRCKYQGLGFSGNKSS